MAAPAATLLASVAEELAQGTVVLNDGRRMPRLGYGTASGDKVGPALLAALRMGYRLIDTAVAYRCERTIAQAIAASGVPRGELFVVSKAWPFVDYVGKDRVNKPTKAGVALIEDVETHISQLSIGGYLDLLLLHWPTARLREHWEALCQLQRTGMVRSIGLSNVGRLHLEQLSAMPIQPTLVQTELAPVATDRRLHADLDELIAHCDSRGIVLMSHSPLRGAMRDQRAVQLARAHRVGVPQLLLRYSLQRGFVAIFGSLSEVHDHLPNQALPLPSPPTPTLLLRRTSATTYSPSTSSWNPPSCERSLVGGLPD